MLEQDRLTVGKCERQPVGRFDRKLWTAALQQTVIILCETGRVEVRLIAENDGIEHPVEIIVVDAGVGTAATVEAAHLHMAPCEDPGAGVAKIGSSEEH